MMNLFPFGVLPCVRLPRRPCPRRGQARRSPSARVYRHSEKQHSLNYCATPLVCWVLRGKNVNLKKSRIIAVAGYYSNFSNILQ